LAFFCPLLLSLSWAFPHLSNSKKKSQVVYLNALFFLVWLPLVSASW
jgi:hypothetical protein